MRRFVTLLVLTLALPSLAQEEPAAPSPAPRAAEALPDWSVGFGAGLGSFSAVGGLVGPAIPSLVLMAPRMEGTVERRLGARTWWVFGMSASYNASRRAPEIPPAPLEDGSQETVQGFAGVSTGVRHWLTDRSAPVILSVAGLAEAGYSRALVRVRGIGSGQPFAMSGWVSSVGVSGQFAAERFLAEHLSLRLRLQVLRLGHTFGRERLQAGVGPISTSGFHVEVPLSPAIELRMYF